MREFKCEHSLRKALDETPAGEDFVIKFTGEERLVFVEFEFHGGWIVKHEVRPGQEIFFKKGIGPHPQITINILPDNVS